MKSEPYPKANKLSYGSEDHSSDVDDPSQSENELRIVTSAEEEEKEEEIAIAEKKNEGGVGGENNDCDRNEISTCQTTEYLGSINANFFFEELSPDDEIFTFQCPRNFNVKSLLNQEFDLNKVSKIKDGGNKFKCQVLPNNKKTFTCIFPSKEKNASLVNIPVAGHILIKQSIKLPKKIVVVEEMKKIDKMKIKEPGMRHPLLGKNWNEHVRVVRKQIKRQKKILRKSMERKKSLVKAEKERKEQKKILKAQLSLLKKSLSTETLWDKSVLNNRNGLLRK